MAIKQVMIFVDQGEQERRLQAEASVSRVLAAYSGSILAEVDETQAEDLARKGFLLEPVAGNAMIKLRSLEFDPMLEVPAEPQAMKFLAAEAPATEESYWIVQFVGPAKAEWIEEARKLGASLGDYIPENAFMVRMTGKEKDQLSKLDFVRYVGPYQPAYKISPLLMGVRGKIALASLSSLSISSEAFKPSHFGNLRVLLHRAEDAPAVQEKVERLGGSVISVGQAVLRVSLDPARIAALAGMPGVQWIEPYVKPKIVNDVASGIIGVQPVWNHHGLDGEGQIIAVADTGLDTGNNDATMHDDFEGRIVAIHSWPMATIWSAYRTTSIPSFSNPTMMVRGS